MDQLNLQATTIVETVTAALLVMISLGIGLSIYINVLRSEQLVAQINAQTILSRIAEETDFNQTFISDVIHQDGLFIEKNIRSYSAEHPEAILLTLTAYDGHKNKLITQKEILYPDHVQ